MKYTIYSVHLVDFPKGVGGELYGKHYSIILTDIKRSDNTLVVIPIDLVLKMCYYDCTRNLVNKLERTPVTLGPGVFL